MYKRQYIYFVYFFTNAAGRPAHDDGRKQEVNGVNALTSVNDEERGAEEQSEHGVADTLRPPPPPPPPRPTDAAATHVEKLLREPSSHACIYGAGQKSKLLILSEYANKTENRATNVNKYEQLQRK